MGNCSSNTIKVGRPTAYQYDSMCNGMGGVATPANGCSGSGSCGYYVDNADITPRKNREAVRERIKDYVLLKLGAPVIQLELDDQQINEAIDETLDIVEDYAPRDFFDYYVFNTTPGKSVYKMPDDIGIIRNVFYKQTANFAFQASDLDGVIPIEYFYPGASSNLSGGGMVNPIAPVWGKMGEWALYKGYEQMFSKLSSNLGGWEWVSDMGYIKLYPTPCNCSRVIVHYLQKCKDWNKVTQAIREGALIHSMIILGNIRGKFQQPPGPGGGMQLDGQYMRDKGWELKEKWQDELINRYGDLLYISLD